MKLSKLIEELQNLQRQAAECGVLIDPEIVIVSEFHNGTPLADDREPILWEGWDDELWLCVADED